MGTWTQTVVANAAMTTSVAAAQTTVGAGNLTLASSTVTFGSGTAQRITLTSTGNISARTFTITGTGPNGAALVSTLAGPNNNTVTSIVAYASVTQIAVNGAVATNTSAGNSATAESIMYVTDYGSNPFSIGFGCIVVSGSPTYSVQHTFDDVEQQIMPFGPAGTPVTTAYNYGASTNTWFNHAVVVAQTANDDGNYAFPVTAIRLIVTVAGTVTLKLLQSGMGFR